MNEYVLIKRLKVLFLGVGIAFMYIFLDQIHVFDYNTAGVGIRYTLEIISSICYIIALLDAAKYNVKNILITALIIFLCHGLLGLLAHGFIILGCAILIFFAVYGFWGPYIWYNMIKFFL